MAVERHLPIVKNLVCPNEAATQDLAQALASAPGVGQAFVALHGDLGAGKTTLVRHLLRALGVEGRIKSPTYAVVEPHDARLQGQPLAVWHFDFYRFSDPREWEDAGFRDIFASPGLKLAEWPEKAAAYLPVADLDVRLDVHDEQRHISLTANTVLGADILEALAG
jgi:tRNA threonylcarbamoyladenosine biosynthesis protein TsaE